MASRPITTLPGALRSSLRSTTILTSLSQIIFELVQNSLDAGASQIDVGVDVEAWQCWVRDNGTGMNPTGMNILAKGGEDGRYGTSKAYNSASLGNVCTFGFRGEALASAADLTCLEICSRTSASRETWSVIIKGGKKLYYGPAVRWKREQPGTTVCIRDAFYNLPIRRRSHPNSSRTLELIRKDLECIALVFPNITFSLENSTKEAKEGNGKGRILTIPKTTSSLSAFRHLFGRALCEHVQEINVSMDDIRVEGFLSLEGAPSKVHQYLYVNRHPLSLCDLHRAIDSRFAASSFGKHAFSETGETKSPRPTSRRSPRKNERRPVYVLNVHVPPCSVDNCLEPAKSAIQFKDPDSVANLLSTVVHAFLVRHGFCSAASKATTRAPSGSPSPRKRRKVAPKMESNEREDAFALSTDDTPYSTPPSSATWRKQTQATVLNADPSQDEESKLEWTDPSSGQKYIVDSRTGNSYIADSGQQESDGLFYTNSNNFEGRRRIVDTSRLRKVDNFRCSEEECVPEWLHEALEGWENPTFGLQDPGIQSMTSVASSSRRPWLKPDVEAELVSGRQMHFFDPKLAAGRKHNAVDAKTSFDKDQLKHAKVVGQVDKKFVACLINDETEQCATGSKVLVLVDQHAADERIRVEQFLSDLCRGFINHGPSTGVETWELKPAVPVLLTRLEVKALARSEMYRCAFERWGFRFAPIDMAEEKTGDEYQQVWVNTIPSVVSEKLLALDELREVIKGFLARLEVDGAEYTVTTTNNAHWTTALRWCPRELLDLVNSKACRGAIMFNDSLNVEQCGRLISQLSDTVWPFMCAHGRPSLVPLTNIVSEERRNRGSTIAWHNLA